MARTPTPQRFPLNHGEVELEEVLHSEGCTCKDGHQRELWHLVGSKLGHVLEHLETVKPRHGDVDIAHNVVDINAGSLDSSLTLAPNATFTAVNNTPKEFRVIARPGWVAHVTGVKVAPLNPTQTMALVAVRVELNGRIVQQVPSLEFVRPLMLDRDDVLRLLVSNTSGGDLPLQYALSGWLRANKE